MAMPGRSLFEDPKPLTDSQHNSNLTSIGLQAILGSGRDRSSGRKNTDVRLDSLGLPQGATPLSARFGSFNPEQKLCGTSNHSKIACRCTRTFTAPHKAS